MSKLNRIKKLESKYINLFSDEVFNALPRVPSNWTQIKSIEFLGADMVFDNPIYKFGGGVDALYKQIPKSEISELKQYLVNLVSIAIADKLPD